MTEFLQKNIPTIRVSSQATLIIYRLLSGYINNAHESILSWPTSTIENILANIEKDILKSYEANLDKAILTDSFMMIEKSTKRDLERQIIKLTKDKLWMGVFPSGLLDNFVTEHMQLIKNVRLSHINKISSSIQRGIRQGLLQKDIAKEILHNTNLSKKRARLIARNAPLQYSGALTKHHQMSAGIKSYIWQTSRDERVRDSHRKYDGELFGWDSKGPHPRSEVNCRCDAVPVLGF